VGITTRTSTPERGPAIGFIVKGKLRRQADFYRDLAGMKAALAGAAISVSESAYPGHSIELARAACQDCDYLIAVGGDGTLNETLNGYIRAKQAAPGRTLPVLGVLPRGTANDFARHLGQPPEMANLTRLIQASERHRIDIGRVRCKTPDGDDTERFFLNVADVGIGATVVSELERSRAGTAAWLRYPLAIARAFFGYRPSALRLSSANELLFEGRSLAVAAANGRFFGSGLCIAPDARLADGMLSVTVIGDVGVAEFIANLHRLKAGKHLHRRQVNYHQLRSLEIRALGPRLPLEADGEFLGYTPADIDIIPGAVKFLMPGAAQPTGRYRQAPHPAGSATPPPENG
jgi:YegS/Rv2252/BmrU family lipid kinase